MGLTQLNFAGLNKVEVAIERLRMFEPITKELGFYFADSYGKDSGVVDRLLDMAKVKHDAHYGQGGIDPPELFRHGRLNHPETIVERPIMSIWRKAEIYGLPTRIQRWCCELIKEKGGSGRVVVTGIRWQESPRRSKRQMVEICRKDKTKTFLHPIIDWSAQDVWEFTKLENIPYCSLYDEGFKRLGCVLCPMHTPKQTQLEIMRFPKLAEAWHRVCYRIWEKHPGEKELWESAEIKWQRWLSRKGKPKVDDAQCIMFDN